MRVDIIGAGPTGITVAWLMSKTHEVHVWDIHDTCGGSWWEPPAPTPEALSLHAPRVVFKDAFVNTNWLFDEMGLDWDKYFKPGAAVSESIEIFLKRFSAKDYFEFVKFLFLGFRDDGRTVKDHLEGKLTPGAERLVATLPIVMDGVDWSRMTAWEFIQSFNSARKKSYILMQKQIQFIYSPFITLYNVELIMPSGHGASATILFCHPKAWWRAAVPSTVKITRMSNTSIFYIYNSIIFEMLNC